MSKFVFYYGIKALDKSYKHEIIEDFSNDQKALEKWLKLFHEFIKLIKKEK